jgi:MoaA/NifB/PqqE/SkfB family radical SAM enzyme
MKTVQTDRYKIEFNTETGEETLEGINGHEDPFVLDFPILMDVGIMGHCSNDCQFCYQGEKNEPNMTFSNFTKLIDEAKPYVNQVALGGKGDPNQHENFEDILKYCRDNNIVPNYTTSGNCLTDEQIKISKEYVGAVAVSCNLNDEKKYPEYTLDALKRFIDAGVRTNIHYILSNKSFIPSLKILNGSERFEDKFDITKLNAVIFLLFKPQGKGKDLDWQMRDINLNIFSRILTSERFQALRQCRGVNYSLGADSCLINKVMKSGTELTQEQIESIDTCEGGRMSVYITNDLKLVPCSFGNHSEGISLLNTSIKNAWNTELFQKFRERLLNDRCSCPYNL